MFEGHSGDTHPEQKFQLVLMGAEHISWFWHLHAVDWAGGDKMRHLTAEGQKDQEQ